MVSVFGQFYFFQTFKLRIVLHLGDKENTTVRPFGELVVINLSHIHNQTRTLWRFEVLEKGVVMTASFCESEQTGHQSGTMNPLTCGLIHL